MAIDPDLYEKVTGRSPGDAQRRLGESLAKGVADKAKQRERIENMSNMSVRFGLFHPEAYLFRWLIERGGWIGLLGFIVVVAAVTGWIIYKN